EPFLTRLQKLRRPTVVQVLIDPFLAAQLSNAVLATQDLPARCGSSLQRNDAGVWLCEYPGLSFQRSPVCTCSLVSSLLLSGATMSQQSSLTQSAHSVRQVLTAYRCHTYRTCSKISDPSTRAASSPRALRERLKSLVSVDRKHPVV